MVESQTANLIPSPSFAHNLCCRCPNDSSEAISDTYASRTFQWYKKHFRARCFDPYNRVLNFWESRRTPKSPFRECECHPHTPSKWGCDNLGFNVFVFWFAFLFSMVQKFQQPYFVESADGVHEDVTSIAFTQILKLCIWNLAPHC